MTNNQHGQVPEALIDLIDAYAETRHRYGRIHNARTEAARNAVIEALSEVQALSAAPEAIAKLRHLYQNMVNGAVRDTASAKRIAEGLLAPAIEALERATPPAEQQAQAGAVYAELPEPDATTVGLGAVWNRHSMRDFADRTHALRASQGQASSQAGEYPALVCDYCGALTPDPWHSSGMLHGKMSKHIHSCDACAARGAAQAQDTREPLTDEQLAEMMRDTWGCASIAPRHALEFARAVERAHGITQKGGSDGL